MSTRAQKLGAKGVIIDGNFRDVNEHQDLKFPVSFPHHGVHVFHADHRSTNSYSPKESRSLAQLPLRDHQP